MHRLDADLASGIVFLAISAPFGFMGLGYGLGTSLRLGAGVFPLAVSILLALTGIALILRSILAGQTSTGPAEGQQILPWDLRSLLLIVLALLFAVVTLRRFGMAIAVPGTVLIASLASREFRLIPALLLAAFLTAFTYSAFVLGLGVRLQLFAGFL